MLDFAPAEVRPEFGISASRLGKRSVRIVAKGGISNALVLGAPDADWLFDIVIDSANPLRPRITITGIQDGFPAYEIYIREKRVYGDLNADAGRCDSDRCPAAGVLVDRVGDKPVNVQRYLDEFTE